MTNYDLYKIVLNFIRKDRRGGVMTEYEFELELQRMNLNYMEIILPSYEKDQDITDKISIFKEVILGVSLSVSGNAITVPSDYVRHGYLRYKQDGTESRVIDELTDSQWSSRVGSFISTPSERFPICIYRSGNIEFLPTTLTVNYLEYSYIRYPATPYFDGYYDIDGNFIYLAVGASHDLVTGEVGLDGTEGSSPVVPYASSTIELEWDNDDKLVIADLILRRYGIILKEPLVTQYNDQIVKEK